MVDKSTYLLPNVIGKGPADSIFYMWRSYNPRTHRFSSAPGTRWKRGYTRLIKENINNGVRENKENEMEERNGGSGSYKGIKQIKGEGIK